MGIIRSKGVIRREARVEVNWKPTHRRRLTESLSGPRVLSSISNQLGFVGVEATSFMKEGTNPISAVIISNHAVLQQSNIPAGPEGCCDGYSWFSTWWLHLEWTIIPKWRAHLWEFFLTWFEVDESTSSPDPEAGKHTSNMSYTFCWQPI